MEEINEIQSYIVNGYVFETKTEYNEAVQEKKAIKYLSSELNLSNIEKTYKLYCELIEKKIFKTPVGMDYLKKLRDVVIKSGNYKAEDIMPIPVKTTGHMEKERVEKYISTKYETTVKQYESEKKNMKSRLSPSILFNIVLIAVVIAMFIITKNSDSPNILNYERVIQDKYSSWQSELNEKEQELKELEWKINHPEE